MFNATVISGIRTDSSTLLDLAIRKTLVTLGTGVPEGDKDRSQTVSEGW